MIETKELEDYIDSFQNKDGMLIAALHKAQELYGYISRETQRFIAKKLNIHTAKVYGVVTFYSFFTMHKKGRYPISVCTGTACFVRGADTVTQAFKKELGINEGETGSDGNFSLDCLRCVGACGLAPVVNVGGKVYGRVTPDDVKKIIEETGEKV